MTEWTRDEDIIAERFDRRKLPGIFRKEFSVNDDEVAIAERGCDILEEFRKGKFSLSILRGDVESLVFIDTKPKILDRTIRNVYLSDDTSVDLRFIIRFTIQDFDKFVGGIFCERSSLSMEDLWNNMVSYVIFRKILPKFMTLNLKKLVDTRFHESVKRGMEKEVSKALENWGMNVEFAVSEILIEEKYLKEMEQHSEATKPSEAYKPPHEQPETTTTTTEDNKMGEEDKIRKEIEELKKAKEIAEQKYYKKELSEEAFKRMVENFEQRIIELETKLKSKEK